MNARQADVNEQPTAMMAACAAATASPRDRAGWGAASAILVASIVTVLAMHAATVASLVQSWSRNPLGHGYFVVPIAAYLVWMRRQTLAAMRPTPCLLALPVLGAVAVVWLLGTLAATSVVQYGCLLGAVATLTWGVLGTRVARVLAFPLGVLVFALPLGDFFVPLLQDLTASSAVRMLDVAGVPAVLEGHVIAAGTTRWHVADACSGVSYLMASAGLGYVYAGTTYRRWANRLWFLAAAVVLPLAANALRVFATIAAGASGLADLADGMRHNVAGIAIFGAITYLLAATCGGWHDELPGETAGRTPSPEGTTRQALTAGPAGAAWRMAAVAIAGTVLASSAPAAAESLSVARVQSAMAHAPEPIVAEPWRPMGALAFSWRPRFAAPSAETLLAYRSGPRVVQLYMAAYDAGQRDAKLASKSNLLYEAPWWSVVGRHRRVDEMGVRETVLQGRGLRLRVWSWYWVDGATTARDVSARLLLARARLSRSPVGEAAIAIATPDIAGSEGTLADFVRHLSIPATGDTAGHGSLKAAFSPRPPAPSPEPILVQAASPSPVVRPTPNVAQATAHDQ